MYNGAIYLSKLWTHRRPVILFQPYLQGLKIIVMKGAPKRNNTSVHSNSDIKWLQNGLRAITCSYPKQ